MHDFLPCLCKCNVTFYTYMCRERSLTCRMQNFCQRELKLRTSIYRMMSIQLNDTIVHLIIVGLIGFVRCTDFFF